MSWWLAGFLGVVQGITEFLPISSSAHLRIVPAFLGAKDPGASFTAVTQIGTIFSVLIYFRKDLINLSLSFLKGIFNKNLRNRDFNMSLAIIFATLPIIFFGYLGQDFVKTTARNLYLISLILLFFSFIMYAVDRFSKQDKDIDEIDIKDFSAFFITFLLLIYAFLSIFFQFFFYTLNELIYYSRSDYDNIKKENQYKKG